MAYRNKLDIDIEVWLSPRPAYVDCYSVQLTFKTFFLFR
jgi:hypothetical protein